MSLLHEHGTVVISIEIGKQSAQAHAHGTGNHADVATAGPLARLAVDDLRIHGSAQNRFAERQQARHALRCP